MKMKDLKIFQILLINIIPGMSLLDMFSQQMCILCVRFTESSK